MSGTARLEFQARAARSARHPTFPRKKLTGGWVEVASRSGEERVGK